MKTRERSTRSRLLYVSGNQLLRREVQNKVFVEEEEVNWNDN